MIDKTWETDENGVVTVEHDRRTIWQVTRMNEKFVFFVLSKGEQQKKAFPK